MLAMRDTIAFDWMAESCASRMNPDSTIPSTATSTTKRCLCGAISAAAQSPSASPISMLRLRLRITPVSVTAVIAHPSDLSRRRPPDEQGEREGGDDVDRREPWRPNAQEPGLICER